MTPARPPRTRTKLLGNARLVDSPFAELLADTEVFRNRLDRFSRARKCQGAIARNEEGARKPIGFILESLIPTATSVVIGDRGRRVFEQTVRYFMDDVVRLTRRGVTFVVNDVPPSSKEHCYR